MDNIASQENAQCEKTNKQTNKQKTKQNKTKKKTKKKHIKQRSWLSIDSNNEFSMGNSVPEKKKRNNNERLRKEIKSNLN